MVAMHFDRFSFGWFCIDGFTYENDVGIDRGKVRNERTNNAGNPATLLDIFHSLSN